MEKVKGVQLSLTPRYFAARDFFVGASGCWNTSGVPEIIEGIIGAVTDIASTAWPAMMRGGVLCLFYALPY